MSTRPSSIRTTGVGSTAAPLHVELVLMYLSLSALGLYNRRRGPLKVNIPRYVLSLILPREEHADDTSDESFEKDQTRQSNYATHLLAHKLSSCGVQCRKHSGGFAIRDTPYWTTDFMYRRTLQTDPSYWRCYTRNERRNMVAQQERLMSNQERRPVFISVW